MDKLKQIFKKYGVFIVLLILYGYYLKRCLTSPSIYSIKSSIAAQIGIVLSLSVIYVCKPRGIKFWLICIGFVLLYVGTSTIEIFSGYWVASHEYLSSFAMGTSLFFSSYLLLTLSKSIPNRMVSAITTGISILIFLLLLFYPLIFYGYYLLEKVTFRADLVLAIMQTNLREAYEYAVANYSILNCIIIVLTTSVLLYLFSRFLYNTSKRIIRFSVQYIVLILLVGFFEALLLGGILFSHDGLDCLAKRTITLSYFIITDYSKFIKSNQDLLDTVEVNLKDNSPSVHVLIIGESLTRDYMSLYGYKDETSPKLSQIEKSGQMIKFDNAYSNFTMTIPSLSMALTSLNQYENSSLSSSVSLIALAKKAGYKVYWISNQFKSSLLDTPLTSITMQSDETIFAHAKQMHDAKDQDEVILDSIPDIKPDEKVLLILHLFGSHILYKDRYTPEFNIFSDDKNPRVNQYKNSVIYNDWVVSEIINRFKKLPNFKSLLYFSDHGADPTLTMDHNVTHFTFEMIRIPVLIYYSPAYKAQHPKLIDTLKKNSQECFTNDLIFNLQLDLLSIDTTVSDLKYSIGSNEYGINCTNALSLHSKKKVSEDPKLKITQLQK